MQALSFQLFLWVSGISLLGSIAKCILVLFIVVHQVCVRSYVEQ